MKRHPQHITSKDLPKVQQVRWDGVPVLHRPGMDHPQIGHVEPHTQLVDKAGGRSLVITGGLATPLLARIVRSTPRKQVSDRTHVCKWQDVTHMVAGTTHEAHEAFWAREWEMVEEQVAA